MTTPAESASEQEPFMRFLQSYKTVYDLSQKFEYGMPRALVHPEFRMTLVRRHGDAFRPDGTSASSEIIITGGHVGTHVDALAHFSLDGKLYGGLTAEQAQRTGRFVARGIDEFRPAVCRGVLLDVAAKNGVEMLDGGYAITASELAETASHQGVAPTEGDIVFVRTGWARNFGNADAYRGFESGVPGVTEDGAKYLADFSIRATGADTINYEQIHAGQGSRVLPVHRHLLVERGINIIEVCNLEEISEKKVYEFLVMVAPLNIVGATGAPARILALT